jgi:hypothetical protein
MKNFEDILEAEFKKLVPYKPLTAPEIVAIKKAFEAWLNQEADSTSKCICATCEGYSKAMHDAVESLNIEAEAKQ